MTRASSLTCPYAHRKLLPCRGARARFPEGMVFPMPNRGVGGCQRSLTRSLVLCSSFSVSQPARELQCTIAGRAAPTLGYVAAAGPTKYFANSRYSDSRRLFCFSRGKWLMRIL